MASIHRRNFGLPSRLRTYPRRRPLLEILDEEIASLLAWCLLIGAGSVALACWSIPHGRAFFALAVTAGTARKDKRRVTRADTDAGEVKLRAQQNRLKPL